MRRWGYIKSVDRLPSKLINNQSTHINVPPTHLQPTPTGGENFLARVYTFTSFFKNVLEYRNRSKFVWGPNSTSSTIWEKYLGVRKKVSFLIIRPQKSTYFCQLSDESALIRNVCATGVWGGKPIGVWGLTFYLHYRYLLHRFLYKTYSDVVEISYRLIIVSLIDVDPSVGKKFGFEVESVRFQDRLTNQYRDLCWLGYKLT